MKEKRTYKEASYSFGRLNIILMVSLFSRQHGGLIAAAYQSTCIMASSQC